MTSLNLKAGLAFAANRILHRFGAELVPLHDEIWRPLSQLGVQPPPGEPTDALSAPLLKVFHGNRITSLQEPVDFAVVMSTVLRSSITDAIQSVFDQRFDGSIQMLIGIDSSKNDPARIESLCRSIPDRHSVLLFYPGYSTSVRHGGLHADRCGGSMRTILSYLANSRYIAYLDDDNWWSDDHLSTLHAALVAGAEWAYALRWFVHPISRRPICRDEWESVGPSLGYYGGWVDPNCLAIDKIACEAVLRWWSIPSRNSAKAMDADRNVFRYLSTKFHGVSTHRHSVFYQIDETDDQHPYRLSVIGGERYRSFAQPPSAV
jgi:hypothetical protein